jgi:uncharacterized protein YkwD
LIPQAHSSGDTAIHRARTSGCAGDAVPLMLCLHQRARRQSGLRALRLSVRLTEAARAKSVDIARCGFSHTACGHAFEYEVNKTGYRWTRVGENLAWGTGPLGRASAIFSTWLRSPGHRANILDPAFRNVGLAVRRGDVAGRPNAVIWVAEFAAP